CVHDYAHQPERFGGSGEPERLDLFVRSGPGVADCRGEPEQRDAGGQWNRDVDADRFDLAAHDPGHVHRHGNRDGRFDHSLDDGYGRGQGSLARCHAFRPMIECRRPARWAYEGSRGSRSRHQPEKRAPRSIFRTEPASWYAWASRAACSLDIPAEMSSRRKRRTLRLRSVWKRTKP